MNWVNTHLCICMCMAGWRRERLASDTLINPNPKPWTLKPEPEPWALPLLLELLLVSTPSICSVSVLFPLPLSLPLPGPYTSSFSRLFSSSGTTAKKPAVEAPVNVKYNAPTNQIQPSVKKKSSTLQQLPSDKSKAFDFLNEEWVHLREIKKMDIKVSGFLSI